MKVTVQAVRDSDGVALGETIFDIQDNEGRSRAVANLVNSIYQNASDPLNPPAFTLKFDSPK
jgi:hypothetical protein